MGIPDGLLDRVRASAERALPAVGRAPAVEVRDVRDRPRSTLIRVVVGTGDAATRLVVKIPRAVQRSTPGSSPAAGASGSDGRPRLVPETPGEEKARLEGAALRAIADDLAADPRDGLSAVAIVDVYEDLGALVMTEAPGIPLQRILAGAVRGRVTARRATDRATAALEHAGAWLRRFQDLSLAADRPARMGTRAEVLAAVEALGSYLAASAARPAGATELVERLVGVLEAIPDPVPLGLHHGDYAMRNVIVADDGSVAAIDALGRWRMPVHDDVARMLVAIETSRLQSHSLGNAIPTASRRAFADALLAGYGRDRLDAAALAAYSAVILLDKWAARVESRARSRRRLAWVSHAVTDRYYADVGRGLLAPLFDARA